MFNKYHDGWIEVITGPMFAGKSAELIKRAETLIYAKKDFLVIKPKKDDRWDGEIIKSRTGATIESHIVDSSEMINELYKKSNKNLRAIIIDEVQFFDENITDTLMNIAKDGVRVIVAGLDMDFMMRPFGQMPNILAVSEFVTKLTAVCFKCGRAAAFSKRISGSKNKIIETGNETYEARCRRCYYK